VYHEELHHTTESEPIMPSRLFIAFNACIEEKETAVREEEGIASLRDTLEPLLGVGYCPENMWDYLPQNLNATPPAACLLEGNKHRGLGITSLAQDILTMEAALASGEVIVFGMLVYPQYESQQCLKDGIVAYPSFITRHFTQSLGGHAQLIVGYDHATQMFKVRGSWGPDVADHGHFHIPYAYMADSKLAFDFQVLTGVENLI
jgi:hypothetical protein